MLNRKVEKAINDQINAEWFSEYLYYSMSAYFMSQNLPGFANWMNVQAQEEHTHAMKFYDYVHERGGRVTLKEIEAPHVKWGSPLAAFEVAYKHELKVTALINGLMDLSLEESDHATAQFLQWFVAEQVEEEAAADAIVQQLKMIGDSGNAMMFLDQRLAQRAFTPPAASAP